MATPLNPLPTDYRRKIVSLEHLRDVIREQRALPEHKRPTFVQCHGCFDIVHPGHIRYLQFAKAQGDCLIVSITGDAGIDKGDHRPYIPQELRAENLAALEFVDYVVIDRKPTAAEILNIIKPDVYVKGHEYAVSKDPRFLAEREVVESTGGRVIFSSGQVVFSSSRLGEGFGNADELEAQRLAIVCARHNIAQNSMRMHLDQMRGKRLVIAGDSAIERYILCDSGGVASESPMMSLTELDRRDYCGAAAFVALQAAALGAKTTLLTRLGEDRRSAWLSDILQEAGVELRCVDPLPEIPVRKRYLVDDHKVLKVERGGGRPLDSVGQREAAALLSQVSHRADAAILIDCGFGLLTPGLLSHVRGTFRQQVPILGAAAGDPRGDAKGLPCADIILTSERRLRGTLNDYGSGLSTLAYQLMQTTQTKRMIVTVGKRGLVTFDRPSHDPSDPAWKDRLLSEYFPSLALRVSDRLGCAESSLTIATLSLACASSLMQAAYWSAGIAAMQIAQQGPTAVTAEALSMWLAGRPELSLDEEDDFARHTGNMEVRLESAAL